MNSTAKISIILLALCLICAIKPHYGGEITIRLNEPDDFIFNPSSYSNLIFYSLIYENLFYLKKDGRIETNIFKEYKYDSQTRILNLVLKDNLSFSNGKPITPQNVKSSLSIYLDMNLVSSRKLRKMCKRIDIFPRENRIIIESVVDNPSIVDSLTAPELVLVSGSDQVFSGVFHPVEWVQNQYLLLKPNPFYPGGRSYLDSIKIIFYDFHYPDVFISTPNASEPVIKGGFDEVNAGVFQNIYLAFPKSEGSNNTRIAVYSLLKNFFLDGRSDENPGKPSKKGAKNLSLPDDHLEAASSSTTPYMELNSLTSNDESPITLNIRTFPFSQSRTILRYSKVNLYILSSLKDIEKPFSDFLTRRGVPLDSVFINDSQLINFMNNTPIDYLLMGKIFTRQLPLEEKIKIILKEMSFGRFDETYLKLLNQLDEVKYMNNEELAMDLMAGIIEKIVDDGFILPICQKRYSLYIKKNVKGLALDYYGKPLFQEVGLK